MEIKERSIKGVFEITLRPNLDERGFFMRAYDKLLFEKSGLMFKWLQENHSRSEMKGIIRGLHLQRPPFAETKLVRCIRGAVMDVFVDLRESSATFGQWDSIELSEQNRKMILIPRGFAHGFCTLTDESEVLYKVDNIYSKEHELGLLWNDNDLNITWPVADPFLSDKDKNNFTLQEFIKRYKSIKV
jgi:dTDP-4-dehydrorhamnose 3,5-epimerase